MMIDNWGNSSGFWNVMELEDFWDILHPEFEHLNRTSQDYGYTSVPHNWITFDMVDHMTFLLEGVLLPFI